MAERPIRARAPMSPKDRLRRNRTIGFAIAFLVFVFDQATKWTVTYPLRLAERPPVEPGGPPGIELLPFFNLAWVENRGVSMGFLTAGSAVEQWLLVGLTAGIALFVGFWMWREQRREDAIALAMILGGALGNIVDRLRYGYVVDFADLHFGDWRPFLVFNVADAAITIGVLLLIVRALLVREDKPSRKEV